jgi:site-specific DNA-methyltransferase (adenine-specific)
MTLAPYYSDSLVTIYHGDCREVMPFLRADLLLTDPPYGIGADARQANRAGKQHGAAKAPSRDYGAVTHWDASPPERWVLEMLLTRARRAVVWGGNFFDLPPTRGWLVWDKETGDNGYADAELAWTNIDQAVRRFRHRWMGMLTAASDDGDTRVHPTQKPVPVMRWCIGLVPDAGSIIDPFMGSGSTLRAAKDLGRCAIGIEIEERYCEIAAERCRQEVLDFGGAA